MLRRLPVVAIASVVFIVGCDRDETTAPSADKLVTLGGRLAAASLSVIDLGVGSTTSVAFAINDKGEVVGYTQAAVGLHATFWDPSGAMTDLGVFPGGTYSEAHGINNGGVVVGQADTVAAGPRAFVWQPGWGLMFSLPLLPGGSWATATDINDFDVIVGAADDASGFTNAVRWDAGGISTLGALPGGVYSTALAISNNEIVGYSLDATSTMRPVRWSPLGGIKDLGTLPGDASGQALAINDEGQIVGYSYGSSMHAVLWSTNGGIKYLGGLPGGKESQATGINVVGDISGWAYDATGAEHAVLWERGSLAIVDLGTLPGHMASAGNAINRNATVAGFSASNVIQHATCWSFGPSC
jgi:probable HAF family extracellular repeat protein